MSDSDLSKKFRLAYRALLLVAKGASERGAVDGAARSDPGLASVKREALSLVLGIVSEQDLLDRLVQNALPGQELGISARCLFRLAAHAVLRSIEKGQVRRIERSLRDVAPTEALPKLEFLLGSLLGVNPFRKVSVLSDSERVGFETHHPVWWVEYCYRVFGRGEAIELLSAGPRPRYIRVNPLKNRGRASLPKETGKLSERLTRVPSTSGVYRMDGSPSAFSRFFSQGLFQMQDLASFLAVKGGDPKFGEKVLDLCAAPGAKTAVMAQLMKNRGRIVSVDYSRRRMTGWKREIERLGVEIAEPIIGDATRLGVHESFDLVIIDPPCSGTGVFDRNPGMKWHLSAQSVERYSTLQRHLLDSALPLVSQDGRILYCTCSLTTEENEQVVSTFLKSHPEFETRPVLEEYGSPGLRGLSDCRRFYPHRDRTAGYFVALMQQVS